MGRFSALTLLLALLLTGCQASVVDPATDVATNQVPSSPEDNESGPSEEPSGSSLVEGFTDCESEDVTDVFAVVSGQVEAFGEGDFAAAYRLASPVFRLGVNEAAFEQLIRRSYQPLLEATRLEVLQCVIDRERGVASMDVRVTSGEQRWTLLYLLEGTEEGWRIGGAADLIPETPRSTTA